MVCQREFVWSSASDMEKGKPWGEGVNDYNPMMATNRSPVSLGNAIA